MKTLVCFGDSNTHGTVPMRFLGDRRRYDRTVRWPGVAAKNLGAQWQVIEEGHPGRTTVHDDPIEGAYKNGLPAISVAMETHRPVDVIAILLGTNDLKTRYSVTAQDIAISVDKLIATALASQGGPDNGAPQVLLIAPPPIIETGCLKDILQGGAAKSTALGGLLGKIAAARSIPYLDAGMVIQSSPTDGIHWEPDDHAALGQAIAGCVSENWG